MRVCRGGRVKNWYFSLKDSEYKIKRKKNNKKTEHSEIKQFGNNNNSVPKSKSILRVHHNQQWVGYVEKCRL